MKTKISLGAGAVSAGMRALVYISTALTGESVMRRTMGSQKPPYHFGSWRAPKGYANREIPLENARGFLLQKESAPHKKIFYQIHGGGFVSPFSDLYNRTALHFSQIGGDADVFSVDYRTAPENVFPAALMDALDGWHWLLKQGYAPENITLCGESAGGGLCLALTMRLRDRGEPLPKALVLSSPWADMTAGGESYQTKKTEDAFFGHPDAAKVPSHPVPTLYAGSHDLYDPYLSPVFGDYHDFPPMLIQTGEAELLLSDSNTVAERARKAGVQVDYRIYPGMYHTFYIVTPSLPESKTAWQRVEHWLAAQM